MCFPFFGTCRDKTTRAEDYNQPTNTQKSYHSYQGIAMAKSNAPISGICKRKITAADLLIAWWFLPRMNLHPFKQHEATVNILLIICNHTFSPYHEHASTFENPSVNQNVNPTLIITVQQHGLLIIIRVDISRLTNFTVTVL